MIIVTTVIVMVIGRLIRRYVMYIFNYFIFKQSEVVTYNDNFLVDFYPFMSDEIHWFIK